MTEVPLKSRKLIIDAAVALTTVQSELAAQKEFFRAHGQELPPEVLVLDRLVNALHTIFDYGTRNGFTIEGAVEAMGRDMSAEMVKLAARTARMKRALLN